MSNIKNLALALAVFMTGFSADGQNVINYNNDWENFDKSYIKTIFDRIVYDNNSHAAFTSLESFNGNLYLAFREGEGHVPTSENDKGKIVVLMSEGDQWVHSHTFAVNGIDLRDPNFLKLDNKLILYSLGYYSELTDNGWTELSRIKHNAPHSLNIWKKREYKGVIYGIGNAYQKWPLLLTSLDGVNWEVKSEYRIGGNASEADMCFINDKVYICLRTDEPVGSLSLFGIGSYPFDDISWTIMDISIASPDFIKINNRKLLLAGREYDTKTKERYMSVFTIDRHGKVLGKTCLKEDGTGDKGYSSFCRFKGKLFMSYYTGRAKTNIHLIEIE